MKKLKSKPKTTIKISGEIAWLFFTDSVSKPVVEKEIQVIGEERFGKPFLIMRTVLR